MHTLTRKFPSLVLAVAVASPAAVTGCAARARYSYYDRDHHDYHRWDHSEVVFYVQWENETHRTHRDFRKRGDDEQNEYWKWCHEHDRDSGHR
jgi:hypothetical protein